MGTSGVADIVFCIDASSSMKPCIDAVRENIQVFVRTITSGNYSGWDLRFDFVAHSCGEAGGPHAIRSMSHAGTTLVEAIYKNRGAGLFTKDLAEFERSLGDVEVQGDEMSLFGLDFALDFPWRPADTCRRVVVFLTDEPLETGVNVDLQKSQLRNIIAKVHQNRVMLFLVAPNSDGYEVLASADKCIYEAVDESNSGLRNVKFGPLLQSIGKSITSAGALNQDPLGAAPAAPKGLFGQEAFGTSDAPIRGA